MYGKYRTWAPVPLMAVLLSGCATMDQEQRQQATGAAVGGAIGAVTCVFGDCDVKDLALRTAAGAAVGWGAVKVHQIYSNKTASAEQETELLGYSAPQGTLIKLQGASVEPEFSDGGEELRLSMEYTILAPSDDETLSVSERWSVYKDGQLQVELDNGVHERDQGRWVSHASFDLPKEIEAGTYVVKNEISSGSRYDVQQVPFYVGVQR